MTTWNDGADRGLLTAKVYDDSSSVTYSNTPAGRLARRTWARGITTTYGYNNSGELTGVTYSDSSPAVAAVYDRRGRRVVASSVSDETSYSYNAAGQLLAETHTAGPLADLTVTKLFWRPSPSPSADSCPGNAACPTGFWPRAAVAPPSASTRSAHRETLPPPASAAGSPDSIAPTVPQFRGHLR